MSDFELAQDEVYTVVFETLDTATFYDPITDQVRYKHGVDISSLQRDLQESVKDLPLKEGSRLLSATARNVKSVKLARWELGVLCPEDFNG